MPPPFRADHVGSLLRPASLRDAFRRHQQGQLDTEGFRGAQDQAIRRAVALQEAAGLRPVTDGEFRRASYWSHMVDAVDGLSTAPARFHFADDTGAQTAFLAPQVTGPLRRPTSFSAEAFRFLAQTTTQTPKVTLPAPSTMHFWRGLDSELAAAGYDTLTAFLTDLGAVYRAEIADLAALGATYLQLDEVALAMLCDPDVRDQVAARGEDPEALVWAYADAIRQAIAGRPAGVTVTMHMCRGNYKGRYLAAGGYEPVAEAAFAQTGVDALFLEFDSPRAGDLAALRHVPDGVAVVLGLVSTKTPALEPVDDLLRRIEETTRYLPADQLGLSPQCGFASTAAGNPLTEDDQRRKLALVVETAARAWGTT